MLGLTARTKHTGLTILPKLKYKHVLFINGTPLPPPTIEGKAHADTELMLGCHVLGAQVISGLAVEAWSPLWDMSHGHPTLVEPMVEGRVQGKNPGTTLNCLTDVSLSRFCPLQVQVNFLYYR